MYSKVEIRPDAKYGWKVWMFYSPTYWKTRWFLHYEQAEQFVLELAKAEGLNKSLEKARNINPSSTESS